MNLKEVVQDGKQPVAEVLSQEEIDIVNRAVGSNCRFRSCPNFFSRCPTSLWNDKLPACYKNPDRFDGLEYEIKDSLPGAITFLKNLETMTKTDFEVIQAQPLPTLKELLDESCRR